MVHPCSLVPRIICKLSFMIRLFLQGEPKKWVTKNTEQFNWDDRKNFFSIYAYITSNSSIFMTYFLICVLWPNTYLIYHKLKINFQVDKNSDHLHTYFASIRPYISISGWTPLKRAYIILESSLTWNVSGNKNCYWILTQLKLTIKHHKPSITKQLKKVQAGAELGQAGIGL